MAGVEIDERPIELEGLLNLSPIELVFRDDVGRLPLNRRSRLDNAIDAVISERDGRAAQRARCPKKCASSQHGETPGAVLPRSILFGNSPSSWLNVVSARTV